MNSWNEKIALRLFLIIGLNTFAITHTEAATVKEIEVFRDCPISGQVYLRLSGSLKNGQLYGQINNESVAWSVFSGRVTGFINNHSVLLIMREIKNSEYSLVGWTNTQRIDWRSFGGSFNEYVNCY
ncbi:MAG: hypothetical protein K2Q18_14885 [Bdellovibrionales bacterium]|nr:hypothetical protein [Bdellovibrionales bacterium]